MGRSNAWLTTILLPEDGPTPTDVTDALRAQGIEARHLWKPMHLQPVFAEAYAIGGGNSERVFMRGLCLPSGAKMTDDEVDQITAVVTARAGAQGA